VRVAGERACCSWARQYHGARCCEPSLCLDVESLHAYLLETLLRFLGVPKNASSLAGFFWERNLTNGSNPPTGQTGSAAATSGAAASTNAPPVPSTPPLVNPLGFIQSSLAGITVDDLLKNKPALTMLLHDHNRLTNENVSLNNSLNTANTYVRGYEETKTRSKTGAIFQAAAAIPIAFSINILTGGNSALTTTGWAVLAIGVVFQAIGLYYAFWGED
jgi:hypothetical protein